MNPSSGTYIHCPICNSIHYVGHNSNICLNRAAASTDHKLTADFTHENQSVSEEVWDQCVHEGVIEESKLVSFLHASLLWFAL